MLNTLAKGLKDDSTLIGTMTMNITTAKRNGNSNDLNLKNDHPLILRKYRPTITDDKLVMFEHPDVSLCESVWRHELLYPDHKILLLRYCNDALGGEDNAVKVEYHRKKFGRFTVKNQLSRLSSTTMWCRVRSALFGKTEDDIDIINAHPNIVRYLNMKHDITNLPALDNFCKNRKDIFSKCEINQEAIDEYNLIICSYVILSGPPISNVFPAVIGFFMTPTK